MGLSLSLFAGITGLRNHQERMDVIGNNIANVNTIGFKSSRMLFSDQISQTLRSGSSPSGGISGTDPVQKGLGMQISTIQTNFSEGGRELTGIDTDLSIEGEEGFFVVKSGDSVLFSRDGSFRTGQAYAIDDNGDLVRDASGNPITQTVLVTSSGYKVQGRIADPTTGLISNPTLSNLEDIALPIGEKRLAKATSRVAYSGNLKADGDVATTGTRIMSSVYFSDALLTIPADATTDLASVYDSNGVPMLAPGNTSITASASKGTRSITGTFNYGALTTDDGTTLRDFANWMEDMLGINSTNDFNLDGAADAGTAPSDPGLTNASDDGVQDGDGLNEARVVFGQVGAGSQKTTHNDATYQYVAGASRFTIANDDFDTVAVGDHIYVAGQNMTEGFYTVTTVNAVGNFIEVAGRASLVDGPTLNTTVETSPNRMFINGNLGTENAISNITISSGGVTTSPFEAGLIEAADGESVSTSTVFYDSLGGQHRADVTYVLVSRTNTTSTWRWYAESPDDATFDLTSANTNDTTDADRVVGSGSIVFNDDGQYVSESIDTIQIDYENAGTKTRLIVDPDFQALTQFASQLGSEVNVKEQDGLPVGTLEKFTIGADGVVTGIYSNGLTEEMAQLSLARFGNKNGLNKVGNNMFEQTSYSGAAQVNRPGSGGVGMVQPGSLEQSNVDLSQEFTNLIITQRGFQGNARVITTSDEMLVELVNLKR